MWGRKILCGSTVKLYSDGAVKLSSHGTFGARAPGVRSSVSVLIDSRCGELKILCDGAVKLYSDGTVKLSSHGTVGAQAPGVRSSVSAL